MWDRNYLVVKTSFGTGIYPDCIRHTIYTDGSKMEGKTGSGFASFYNRESTGNDVSRVSDSAIVFQAEVFAIRRAAQFIIHALYINKHVRIYCDSQAALLAISHPFVESKTVHDCIIDLLPLGRRCPIGCLGGQFF